MNAQAGKLLTATLALALVMPCCNDKIPRHCPRPTNAAGAGGYSDVAGGSPNATALTPASTSSGGDPGVLAGAGLSGAGVGVSGAAGTRSMGLAGDAGVMAMSGSAGTAGAMQVVGEGTCLSPIVVGDRRTFVNQSTAKGSNLMSGSRSTCFGADTAGPERFYKVRIPATTTTQLKVTVTPSTSPKANAFDPAVYLIQSCDDLTPVCFAASDRRGGGGPEVLTYTNSSGWIQELLVVVDGFDFQPKGGAYQIGFELTQP